MKYKVVLFDLDGTLMDTSPGVFYSALSAMRDLGKYVAPDTNLRPFVGPPLRDCFKITFGLEEELADKACDIYRKYYHSKGVHMAEHYPHCIETLKTLKKAGCRLAVCTNKLTELAVQMGDEFGWGQYFDAIYGSDLKGKITKTQSILKAVDELAGGDKSIVLMVGDSMNDGFGAIEAGVEFQGVWWGFGLYPKDEKQFGLPFLNSYADLPGVVL